MQLLEVWIAFNLGGKGHIRSGGSRYSDTKDTEYAVSPTPYSLRKDSGS